MNSVTGRDDLASAAQEPAAAPIAFEQRAVARRIVFDDLVAQSCDALGVPPACLGS